ncbi:MAG: CBS domain-containing protein [Proteobacteria bacterium]|nr:CBS domain-containing protein [Pseudomonadota bacterium]
MPSHVAERKLKAHADVAWKVISDHDVFTAFAPAIVKAETISGDHLGLVRRMHHESGAVWEEKCIAWDEKKSFTMEVETKDYILPVKKMLRTWSMEEGSKNITIQLKFEWITKYGPLGVLADRFRIYPMLETYTKNFMDKLVSEIYTGEWEFHVTAAIILENKGTEVISVGPDMSVYDGNKLLAERRIGSAVVLDSNGDLIGVFSERDVVTGLAEFGADVLTKPLTKVMTHDVIVGYPNDTLQELMSCMTDRRIRHIPIVDGGKLKGIVSIGDVVKARMDELETEGAAMQDYIDNRRWREVAFQVGRAAATEQVG